MLRVDTNVLIRIILDVDPEQTRRASALLEGQKFFVAKTVLPEMEWVLRSRFNFGPAETLIALRAVVGTQSVEIEDLPAVSAAFGLTEQGVDFADALHLSSGQDLGGTFVTFDRKLLRAAEQLGLAIREP